MGWDHRDHRDHRPRDLGSVVLREDQGASFPTENQISQNDKIQLAGRKELPPFTNSNVFAVIFLFRF